MHRCKRLLDELAELVRSNPELAGRTIEHLAEQAATGPPEKPQDKPAPAHRGDTPAEGETP